MSASYARMRLRWHQRAARAQVHAFDHSLPFPALTLRPVGNLAPQTLMPQTDHGGFEDAALDLAAQALADKRTGATHAIEPRLLDLVYEAARHFHAPFVHVISGFRDEAGGSRHARGCAIDLVLPGVSDRQLAAHLRRQGFVGVGVYSRGGYVHLDVRARSYFWADHTAPGQRSRARPMMAQSASRYDAQARQRGVVPTLCGSEASDAAATPEIEGEDLPQSAE